MTKIGTARGEFRRIGRPSIFIEKEISVNKENGVKKDGAGAP
jgi:hypothetical protein